MSFIMNTSTKVGSLCLILLTLTKGVFLLECGFSNFSESLTQEEYSFININYTINVTTSPDVTDTFKALYAFCEGNSVRIACRFIYHNDFITEFKKDLSRRTGVTCYWEQRHVSSSVVALDIYISQVVTRSLSALVLSTAISPRLIRVEVLYPPNVTSLTVGGVDFTSPYFINEGQKVNISCSFDKGNPPATFKLLDKHGQVLKSAGSDGYLNYSLTAQCEDDWPIVRCEGSGSKHNRSATFFVRCPPQFVENSINIVNLQTFQVLTFRVKAHTTTLTACLLTPVTLDNNVTRGVSCILSGQPPDLLLTVHLHKETNISQGNWSLILRNEIGSATTTLMITYDLGEDKQSEGKPILSVIIGAVVGSVVAVAVIVVIVIVVIRRRRADPTYASPKSRPAPGEEHEYMDLSDTAGQPNRTADSEQRKQEEGAYEVPVFPPS